jgi:tyrosine-protein kinase Etk/Wzc
MNTEKSKKLEDFLIILVRFRKSILMNVFIVTIAAVIISLLLEVKYTAVVSIIPPKKSQGIFGDLGGFSGTIKDITRTLGGRLGNVSEEAYNYLVILQSRSASERVINKFNLREVYEIDDNVPFEDVIGELEDNVEFKIEDEGNILIYVTDKDSVRAADMANYYVEVLNEISIALNVSEARNNREYIEKRFLQLQSDIIRIEDSLKSFSKKYNILEMEEQLKAAIAVATELKSQAEIAMIERDLLKINYDEDSPLVQNANVKVKELNKRLIEMRYGEDKDLESSLNLFVPFKDIPEAGIQYLRFMRDYEIQIKLLEFIYPIYEQAKIEEQKNIPVVLVLDKAIPPEKKSSPRRAIIVIAAFLLASLFSIGFSIIRHSYETVQQNKDRYDRIKNEILNPIKNLFKLSKN